MSVLAAVHAEGKRSVHGMPAVIEGRRADGWITQAEAARILGVHVHTVKAIALAGGLRTRVIPGARIRYSRADAERLAAAE